MSDSYFCAQTLDDVMHFVIKEILNNGHRISPTKGIASELMGVLLEITDPRARLSRTETRGKPFSCLGELCWYLAGSNDLDFITYYIPAYRKYAEGGVIFGGYGPRLLNYRGLNQVENVTHRLRGNSDSRRAVIQLFDASDITENHKDIPCTCTLQFMVRHEALYMVTNMRSNDAFLGLPHDIFFFTMLQEILARSLSLELGTYKHFVGSLHLYDCDKKAALQFLREGWQSTEMSMPPMPVEDPWLAIKSLLNAEATIRNGDPFNSAELNDLNSYWADLIRLLQVLRCSKNTDTNGIEELCRSMSSPIYRPFIDNKLRECQRRSGQQYLTT